MVGLAVPQLVATVAVLLVSYVALGRLRVARRRRRNGCARPPRYPHKDPFFGLDLFFRNGSAYENNRYLDELTDMYDKNGNTFEALDMGKRSIYTIEPDNLRELFTSAAWGIQPIRLAAMEPFCGRGFLTVDGDLWHKSRKMFQPSFERKAIADFSALETFTQKMIDQIPRDAQTVDMQPLLSSMVGVAHNIRSLLVLMSMQFINATTLFLFGESIEDLEGAEAAQVSKAFDEAMFGSGMRIALGPLDFLAKSKRWQDACRRAQSFAEAYVKTAVDHRNTDRKMPAKSILLHSLAEQTTDREHLRNELLQAFFVAQGTTANAVANTLFLVSRADGLWTILREEVRAVVGHPEAPSYEQLQRLPELRDVVNESKLLVAAHQRSAGLTLSKRSGYYQSCHRIIGWHCKTRPCPRAAVLAANRPYSSRRALWRR